MKEPGPMVKFVHVKTGGGGGGGGGAAEADTASSSKAHAQARRCGQHRILCRGVAQMSL